MTVFSFVFTKRYFPVSSLARSCLLLTLVSCGWMMTGGAHEVQAQEEAVPCADTLETAEKAYRNRNYQTAVDLASQCTDREVVGEDTAIRAHRLITVASLRQGAVVQARTAVTKILRIDPRYTADPVNDPPSYNLFVSMVRRELDTRPPEEEVADRPPEKDAKTPGEGEAETTDTETSPPQTARSEAPFFAKPIGIGFSDYTGDMPAQNAGHPFDFQEFSRGAGFPFVLHGELGYQFASRWALVLGFQAGNYPIVGFNTGDGSISDSWRYTPQLLARYTFGLPGSGVVYYVDGGLNGTVGGQGVASTGYGPSLGGGIDVPISRSLSFYVESRFNFTFPDDAIDGSDISEAGSGGPFDMVSQLLGVGLRIRFGGDTSIDRLPTE